MTRIKTGQQFTFNADVKLSSVAKTFDLAVFAAADLHGWVAVRLEIFCDVSEETRSYVIENTGKISNDVIKLFTGALMREFGEDAFVMSRVSKESIKGESSNKSEMLGACENIMREYTHGALGDCDDLMRKFKRQCALSERRDDERED